MKVLCVAISGGHLAQLRMLSRRFEGVAEMRWITDDTSQSRSLLSGEDVYYVPTRLPRDFVGVLRDSSALRSVIASYRPDVVVSTGAQVALSAAIPARSKRIPFIYVESATRSSGLSVTGKVIDRWPGMIRYTQHAAFSESHARWDHEFSVLDGYQVIRSSEPVSVKRVVVTVGNSQFGFERLVNQLRDVIPEDVEVVWQLGSTTPARPIEGAKDFLPSSQLDSHLREADAVVCHAGTGSILGALNAGRLPVVVPRLSSHGEHVDDHQSDLALMAAALGLAKAHDASELTFADIEEAARCTVVRDERPTGIDIPRIARGLAS